jgi:hemerythrin
MDMLMTAHKNEHQRFISEASFLKEKFINGGELLVMQTLKEWLLNHVLNIDKQVASFLIQQGVK